MLTTFSNLLDYFSRKIKAKDQPSVENSVKQMSAKQTYIQRNSRVFLMGFYSDLRHPLSEGSY